MRAQIFIAMIILTLSSCRNQQAPKENEDRVATALSEKEDKLKTLLKQYQLKKENLNVLFVAYKENNKLQLFAKNKSDKEYVLVETYDICKKSGVLGPKKAEGDKQVPEGFYHINRFNPKSLFHLSLGLNYPNDRDNQMGYTGSDIFIHGKCETVGCLPMTDELIKEIYLYALWSKEAGQTNIPVYIFPFAMTDENISKHQNQVDAQIITFWKNLQEGWIQFQQSQKELQFSMVEGIYIFE